MLFCKFQRYLRKIFQALSLDDPPGFLWVILVSTQALSPLGINFRENKWEQIINSRALKKPSQQPPVLATCCLLTWDAAHFTTDMV